jgi:RNA polymerase sigma-70 factor (ECF subfamily)
MLLASRAPPPEPPSPEGTADEAALVLAVLAGDELARAAFFDRHAGLVQRVLARTLGADSELQDLLHDVFVEAFASLRNLRDPRAVRPWLVGVAAHTARRCIRRRQRSRWLVFFGANELPEPPVALGEDAYGELRTIHRLLGRLGVEEQLVFSLRWLEGMQVDEVAAACSLSRSTTKRRLAAAERRFRAMARNHPELERWFGGAQ